MGAPATTSLAFDFLTKGGKLIIVGLFGGGSTWPIALIPMKALSIIGSYVGNLAELKELMELVRAGKVPPMPVHRYALDQADSDAGLAAGRQGGGPRGADDGLSASLPRPGERTWRRVQAGSIAGAQSAGAECHIIGNGGSAQTTLRTQDQQ